MWKGDLLKAGIDSDGIDMSVEGDVTVGDDLVVTDDAAVGGDLTVTGVVNNVTLGVQAMTASGAISGDYSLVTLNSTTPKIEATIAAPTAGELLVITQLDAGTAGHTVTLTAGTFDGTNDVATFNAAGETLVLVGVSATRYMVVENIGSVAFS